VIKSADLLVLGAGPAGLTAAWQAARAGLRVVLLERAPAVGGLAASFPVAGVRVDHGSHRLHPSTPAGILADLRGLLGNDLQRRVRNGRLRIAGQWVGFPLRPAELAGRLPPPLLGRVAWQTLIGPLRRPRGDTYAEVLRAGLGPALYDELYAPYARKLWGLDGEQIDGEQARRRVAADTPVKIARRMLRPGRDGSGRTFFYPRHGFGQLSEAVADAAAAAGAELRLGSEATRVTVTGEAVTVTAADGWQGDAGHLFSTVPLPVLARICTPGPDPEVLAAAGALRFRAMVLVYLVHQGTRPWTRFDAHYLPSPATPVTRISEPSNYRDSALDPPDRTVLCAELPCETGDPIWTATDRELAGLVTEALARHGLPPVRGGEHQVRRLPRVYPVYQRGYADQLRELDGWAGRLPRVTTFGRLGLFAHDNTHHAMAMAYDAVAALAGGEWDRQAWATARARFASHVVED
jgi:protoporphyrinogen oxidase